MRRLLKPLVRGTLALMLAGIAAISSISDAAAYEVHIVKPGETLSEIAKYYGTTVADLRRLNSLRDANFVWYGQRLLVDGGGTASVQTQAAERYQQYRVRAGDSLTNLARRHGLSVSRLAQINGISPWHWLYRGQVLQVPGSPAPVRAARPAAPVSQAGAGGGGLENVQRYTIRPGDTLTRLAQQHGISLSRLMSMNGLSSTRWLYVGQVLFVPARPASAEVGPAQRAAPLAPAMLPAPPVAAMHPGLSHAAIHTVQNGEFLKGIAGQYGVNHAAIARLNNLTNRSILEEGQALRIPSENALELLEVMDQRLDQSRYPTSSERWIEVDLSEQMAIAYEGATPVRAFVISTGVGRTPTVQGTFRIWAKIAMQDMSGGSRAAGTYYHLRDVKNVQYFHRSYGFHGTYWHDNFGTPMSRGCINMTNEDAKWLFDWTSPTVFNDDWLFSNNANPGTLVMVHE
ncbi:MAG: LysM peptidoglycan-binding domain-containing protein [Caldilineaceae bacterium SB0661_bin_32]|uniref:LysM peptidoglycan-binding domain-containing protein n=1 Tax=Caldilineaceae bacterium SB0661_bin_32 TaxID=2605255 RepID=A0A6B1DAM7_9CHLR|nr:LysM peptidoglycan-binding domain-containing protein [Caldilineaceae bacterium SB0661_bin_32]